MLCYPPLKDNIADDPEDDLEVPITAPGPSNHQQTVCDESFQNVASPHTDSGVAPVTSSASALRIIPATLLATDGQEFSPQSIGRLKALMSKENRTQTLIKVGQRRLPLALMHIYPRMRQVMMMTYLMQIKKTSKWSLMK